MRTHRTIIWELTEHEATFDDFTETVKNDFYEEIIGEIEART